MRRFVSLIVGLLLGFGLGVLLVAFFSPHSGPQFRQAWRDHLAQARAAAAEASAAKRAALERELRGE
jgi:gas vesicle protein